YTKSVSWQHHPFNGSLRDECLNIHWFLSLEDAQDKLDLHPQKFFCGPRANGT
ncbi:TPA: transposase, partial [Klebsiella pneumoniae]|nr:transposase [Klebsiella pneumoniae]